MACCGVLATLLAQGCASVERNGRPPLAETFKAYELTREGARRDILRAGLTEVDVNSSVVVEVNPEVVREQVLRATVREEEHRRVERRVERLRSILDAEALVLGVLDAGASQGDAAQALDVRRRMAAVADAIRRLPRDAGYEEEPSYREHLAYLHEASRKVQEEAEKLATGADVQVTWELQAYTNGVQIHLPGYDSLAYGTPTVVQNRMRGVPPAGGAAPPPPAGGAVKAPAPPPPAGGAVKALAPPPPTGGAVKAPAPARAPLSASEQRIQDTMTQARELRTLQQKIEAQAVALAVKISVQRLVPQGAALKTLAGRAAKAQSLLGAPQGLAESQQVLREAAGKVGQACGRVLGSLGQIEGALEVLADSVAPCRAAAGAMREAAARVAQELRPAPAPRPGRATPPSELEQALEAIQSDPNHASLDAAMVWAELALAQIPASGMIPPPDVDERTAGADKSILSTTIDLLRMEREAGDVLWYRPKLTIKRGDTVESTIDGAPVNMVLVRNGAQVRIAPAVFFVQPFELADDEPAFRPLPAVSATLHGRIYRSCGEPVPGVLARGWNMVDPGVGIHMMVMSLGQLKDDAAGRTTTTNNTFEIGMGVTGQLLGDIVQGGVGYDLQAQRPYWFIGVGLQSLTDFGITIPGIEQNRAPGSAGGP